METQESIEWCNFRWDQTGDMTQPRVLLVGDSIADSYCWTVRKLLEGKANVDHLTTSKCVRDPDFARDTAYAVGRYPHAVIHFNNGLHGEHLTDDEYGRALRQYVELLRKLAPKATLIWASSTPLTLTTPGYPLDAKRNAMALSRNAVAAAAMAEAGIAIDDLYTAVVGKSELCAGDTVHYNPAGRDFLGHIVADIVAPHLKA